MAINFLQNVSLNNTELQNFKVQNVTVDPSVTGEGQLIYRSDSNVLKFYNGSGWVTLDTNAGTVTSVGVSSNYFTIGSSPITSSGTISVDMPASGVVGATYTHATITVDSKGLITSASSGTATLGVTSFTNANGTFVSAGTANTTATGAVTTGTIDLSASGTPGATTFLRGDNTWATPSGSYTSWSLEGDTGTAVDITDGLRVDFTGGTGIDTTVGTATPNTLTIDIADTSVTPGSYTYSSITVDQQGRLTSAASGSAPGTMSSWILTGDSGTQTILDGNTVDIAGGTYITTLAAATDTVTITHDATSRSDTTSSSSPGSAGTFDVIGSVTTNSTGHVTAVDVETITMPTVPTSDNYDYWTLAGDSGANQTISSTNTATLAGGTGISTVGSATDTLTITNTGVTSAVASTGISVSGATGAVTFTNTGVTSIVAGTGISISGATGAVTVTNTVTDTNYTYALSVGAVSSNESTLSLVGSGGGSTTTAKFSGTTNEIAITTPATGDGGDVTIGLPDDVTIGNDLTVTGELTVVGTGQSSIGGQLTVPTTPSASTDAASKSYVDTVLTGALIFQGGYNASTNSPDLDSGTNIAITQGWTYAVTVAGDFFTEAVEIGDVLIANEDMAATGGSALAKWTTVQNNIDIATATVKGIASFPTAGGLSVSTGEVSLPTTGVTAAAYGGVTKSLNATVDAKGRVTAMSENTIAITASQVTDFCTAVTTCIGDNHNAVADIGDNSATTYVVTHSLGTRDVMVQVYSNSAPYDTLNVGVERTSTTVVTLSTVAAIDTDGARVLITEIL